MNATLRKHSKQAASSWKLAADSLSVQVKQSIESEVLRVFTLNDSHPNMFTPWYILRDLKGQGDLMGMAEYASQMLTKHRP